MPISVGAGLPTKSPATGGGAPSAGSNSLTGPIDAALERGGGIGMSVSPAPSPPIPANAVFDGAGNVVQGWAKAGQVGSGAMPPWGADYSGQLIVSGVNELWFLSNQQVTPSTTPCQGLNSGICSGANGCWRLASSADMLAGVSAGLTKIAAYESLGDVAVDPIQCAADTTCWTIFRLNNSGVGGSFKITKTSDGSYMSTLPDTDFPAFCVYHE